MRFEELCGELVGLDLPRAGETARPERAAILAAREACGRAVADDRFLVDCFERELELIATGVVRAGLVPFHTIPELGVRLALGYWAPGSTPGPHEHTAWTITAVCRNELQVVTYDYDESYRRGELVRKNCFDASAGRVGYIFEPCIHAPQNVSSRWSLSLHVSSPRDGERPPGYAEPHPLLATFGGGLDAWHPYFEVLAARQRHRCVHQLARILAEIDHPDRARLLERCGELGSEATRREIDPGAAPATRWSKTRGDVVLGCRTEHDMVILEAGSPMGMIEELRMSELARPALERAIAGHDFDVRALPGALTDHERFEIAGALETTGLFTRATP